MERVFADSPFIVRARLPELAAMKQDVLPEVLAQHARWVPPPNEHNFLIASEHPFFAALYGAFLEECHGHFLPFSLHETSNRRCWCYVQNRDKNSAVWHDHLSTSTINGVFYLSVPDPTGQVHFRHLERTWELTPEEGCLYVFPRWLAHRPTRQQSPELRVSLNIELISVEYPIARDDLTRW